MTTGKQLVLIFLLVLTGTCAKAQVIMTLVFGDKLNSDEMAFGLHMDYSWNNFSGVSPSSAFTNFDAGMFINYKFNEKWRLNVEMMAKYKRGAKGMQPYSLANPVLDTGYAGGTFSRSVGYLSLPVTVQYLLFKQFYLEAGLYGAIRINAKDKFTVDLPEGESALTKDVKAATNTWDFGALAGTGVLLGKAKLLAVGIRYAWGFSDVAKDMSGKQANGSFYVYTNIPIGRARAARKAAEKKANVQP